MRKQKIASIAIIYQAMYRLLAPTGLEIIRLPLVKIVEWLLTTGGFKYAMQLSRNELIRKRYALGEGLSDLAREYGVSPQRVYQIVHLRRK